MECSTAALDEGGGPTRQGDAAPAAPVADGAARGQSADPAAKMAQSRRSLKSSAVNGAELTFVRFLTLEAPPVLSTGCEVWTAVVSVEYIESAFCMHRNALWVTLASS